MKKLLKTLSRHWVKSPVKIMLTLLSVALGTSILILSFSAGEIVKKEVLTAMNSDGLVLHVANGEWGTDGTIEQQRPTGWNRDIVNILKTDSSCITSAAIINRFPFPYLSSNGKSYQIRNIISSDTSYFDVFSLNIISGNPMTDNDYNKGLLKIWISESLAKNLYGTIDKAVGQRISPPGRENGDRHAPFHISQFTVAGVYEDPTEVARRAYGIADAVFPLTAIMNSAKSESSNMDWVSGKLVVKSSSVSVSKTVAEINQIVEANFGIDTLVTSWEGNSNGISTYMNELRQTVSIFTVSINILGIVLLLTSSLGIFSIMVVEALGRKKEIGLERALGSSKIRVIGEFWQWSVFLSFLGAVIGLFLAFLISTPVLGTLTPLLSEFTSNIEVGSSIKPLSIINTLLLVLLCGGILGILPAFSAVKGSISETIREG